MWTDLKISLEWCCKFYRCTKYKVAVVGLQSFLPHLWCGWGGESISLFIQCNDITSPPTPPPPPGMVEMSCINIFSKWLGLKVEHCSLINSVISCTKFCDPMIISVISRFILFVFSNLTPSPLHKPTNTNSQYSNTYSLSTHRQHYCGNRNYGRHPACLYSGAVSDIWRRGSAGEEVMMW